MSTRVLNYLSEFSAMAAAGIVVGLCTASLRPAIVQREFHVMACSFLVGLYSVTLRSPSCSGTIGALLLLSVGRYGQHRYPSVGYCAFVLALSYLAWNAFELARFQIRLAIDPDYRDRWNNRRR